MMARRRRALVAGTSLNGFGAKLAVAAFAAACAGLLLVTPASAQIATSTGGTSVPIPYPTPSCAGFATCLAALNPGSILFSNPGEPVTLTVDGTGVLAGNSGLVRLDGGGSITVGDASVGLQAQGGAITADNLSIATSLATSSAQILALQGGTVTLSGTTTLNASAGGGGVQATGNSTITFDGSAQATAGVPAFVFVDDGGRIDFNGGGSIIASGDIGGGFGLVELQNTTGTPGTVTMTGMNLQLTSTSTLGSTRLFDIDGGGSVELTNTTMTVANSGGVDAYGLAATGGSTASYTLNNSHLTMGSAGAALLASGATSNVTLNSSSVTAFSGGRLAESRTDAGGVIGNLQVNATNATLLGDAVLGPQTGASANLLSMNLGGTSTWTGAATNVTDVNVGAGSTWTVTGNSTVSGTVTNSGTVAFQSGGAFKTLTTTNYVGNSGVLGLNAALGTDGSPSDQLIINGGTATGSTGLVVTNVGGSGGQTTGNGIQVVVAQNGATIASNSFLLNNIVAAGAFQYQLVHGADGHWYLRSSLIPGPPPPGPGPGPGPTPPGPPIPLYRAEVPIYASMAGMARSLNMLSIGSFHDRNGDQGLVRGEGTSDRIWGRVFGQNSQMGHAGTVSGRYEGNAGGVQSGGDIYRVTTPMYDSRFGLFGGYAQARGDVSGFALGQQGASVGHLQVEAFSVGGYWTHMGAPGWYIDAVVMGSRFESDGRSINQTGVSTDGYGVTTSLEAGYPIPLGGGVRLEPQAQLVYQHLAFDDTHDGFSSVAHDTAHALAGRLGLRLAADTVYWGARLSPYLKASVWQDWTGTDKVVFAGVDIIEARQRGTSVEVGGGITAQLANNIGLWASADYTTDVAGDGEREIVRGNLGLRVTW